jgi:membrane protein implicated in regulation of membrane protease activity
VFEQIDSQYVGHMLAEHPPAQIGAAVAFGIAPLLFKTRATQVLAFAGITAMSILLVRRGIR